MTSSAPSSSKTGPSRRDADDSFTSDPQAMPPPPTAKPFRSTDQYAPVLKGEFVSRSIRLQARPNTEPQFCGLEIVNAVLIVGGVAFERRAHTNSHYARTPARARHGPSGGVGSCSKRSRTGFASQSRCWEYWSVYELTHRAPGSRRAAGSRKPLERNAPNLLADYLYLWETTAVRQAIETARTSVSSGGHSSSWCQQRQPPWVPH